MGILFTLLITSLVFLIITHVIFLGINVFFWMVNGIDYVIEGNTFIEIIHYSKYLKWLGFLDIIWGSLLFIFLIKRKQYKTDANLHYLEKKDNIEPKIFVIIPTFNEELIVKDVIDDFSRQKNIHKIIVIDNGSSDKTIEIAESCGVQVIKKDSNKGLADSVIMGLMEFLKSDANIVTITECDGTFSGYDLEKMVPYLNNCDMVIGTRQIQVLTEKGNQNSMFYVWGNYMLAKLIQIKYFSLTNLGIVELTDVGCLYRCIRKESLEKIKFELLSNDAKKIRNNPNSGLIANFLTMIGIENNLKIVEIPITFKKRIGISKTGANKKLKAINYGLQFFWYILRK
jgi:glycosyltransferase involved in cell wall biosynthesis